MASGSPAVAFRSPPLLSSLRLGFLRVLLGLVLILAAVLKAHGFAVDPHASDSILFTPRLQIVTIEIEVVLGLWLLSGWWERAACVTAAGFFAILASVSLYLALAGQRSCGCLGRVEISPWISSALDAAAMVALAALAIRRPQQSATHELCSTSWPGGLLKIAAGASIFLVVAGGVILLAFDDPADALAQLRGESLTVEPSVSQVGDGVARESRTFTVHLKNHTDRPIRVVGGTTTCDCIATNDLPMVVPPHDAQPMGVQMTFKGGAGRFQHRFVFYTDDVQQPVIVARFSGRVVEPPIH